MQDTYSPNLSDKRVLKRAWNAYSFSRAYLKEDKSVKLPKVLLDKHFGQQQTPLAAWLREKLLICTENRYSMYDGTVKEYMLNVPGALFLREHLIEQGFLEYHQSRLSKFFSNNQLIPKRIASFEEVPVLPDGHLFDKEVACAWVQREYEVELRELNFTYEDKSNRWWHPLQNIQKSIRTEVLADAGLYYDYDIETCAPVLIYQYAVHQGLDEYLFGLMDYLKNKDDFRAHIASIIDLGTPENNLKLAKVLINALFCGARLGENRDFALFNLLRKNRDITRALKADDRLNALRADIKRCWKEIEPTLGYREKITDGKKRKIALSSKRKWGCYFELERKVMSSIRRYLKENQYKFFLIHDGWGSDRKVDKTELSSYVLQETGFNISFSEEEIRIF